MSTEHKTVVDQATGEIYIEPKKDCPHIASQIGSDMSPKTIQEAFGHNQCSACGDPSENWICLGCGQVNCSRYVNSHAAKHYDETQHGISLSFSDLSVWCYLCDWYIASPALMPHISAVYQCKFGKMHPAMKKKGKRSKPQVEEEDDSSEEDAKPHPGAAGGASSSSAV